MREENDMTVFSVDFDGTLAADAWPGIGEANTTLIEIMKQCRREGDKVILNTVREGKELEEALAWCEERGLVFDAVNDNLDELVTLWGYNPRKVAAHVYVDDHNAKDGLLADLPFKGRKNNGSKG